MARHSRIGFDARLAGQQHAGIGRYSEELLRALLQKSGVAVTWVVFTFSAEQLPWLEDVPNVERRVVPIRHYTLREQLFLGSIFEREHLDLLHVPHFNVPWFYRRPFVVTIHDLLWHRQRDPRATTLSPWLYALKFYGYKAVTQRSVRAAKTLFVPTQTVAEEIQNTIPHSVPVVVTSEGMSDIYLRQSLGGKQKRAAKKKERAPYFVYTGSLYPHKNIEVALQALQLLPGWKLKLVSSRAVFAEDVLSRAKVLKVDQQVEWLGYQTDADVIMLYQDAVALVQPSVSEGFGLTGLEALASGCPVVSSDIPVFHEVYAGHARYFDPQQPQQLATLLHQLQESPPSVQNRQQAQKHAQSFTWEKVAQKVWKQYQVVLDRLE